MSDHPDNLRVRPISVWPGDLRAAPARRAVQRCALVGELRAIGARDAELRVAIARARSLTALPRA